MTSILEKDKFGDSCESGITMRHPRKKQVNKEIEKELFCYLLNQCKKKYSYIFQQTTTYHLFAQRNIKSYMQAFFCGMIFSYTRGENILGISHSKSDINSMVYATQLKIFICPIMSGVIG